MIAFEQVSSGTVLVRFQTETLDITTSKDFRRRMNGTLERKQLIVLDLSKLTFVDSAGLGALMSCQRQINAAGGEMKLCALSTPVRALFELMQMHRIFNIYNTADEALHAVH